MANKHVNTILRQATIAQYLLRGFPPRAIHQELVNSGIGIAIGTVKNDITEIKKGWVEYLEECQGGNAGADFLQRAFDLRDKAEIDGDLKLAYAITKDIANLLGVSLAERHEIEAVGPVDIEVVWRNGRKP